LRWYISHDYVALVRIDGAQSLPTGQELPRTAKNCRRSHDSYGRQAGASMYSDRIRRIRLTWHEDCSLYRNTHSKEDVFMHISGVISATQGYAVKPASSTGPGQGSAAAGSASQGEYDSSIDGLAGLLSAQGSEIVPPNLKLALIAGSGGSSSSTILSSAGGTTSSAPATATLIATQMMKSLGSDDVLTLADVEKAENGSTAASAVTSPESNSDADIATDFNKLSGGTNAMTVPQLTNAIQQYMDNQNQYSRGFGSRVVSKPG
jgi:hypothetical protein